MDTYSALHKVTCAFLVTTLGGCGIAGTGTSRGSGSAGKATSPSTTAAQLGAARLSQVSGAAFVTVERQRLNLPELRYSRTQETTVLPARYVTATTGSLPSWGTRSPIWPPCILSRWRCNNRLDPLLQPLQRYSFRTAGRTYRRGFRSGSRGTQRLRAPTSLSKSAPTRRQQISELQSGRLP